MKIATFLTPLLIAISCDYASGVEIKGDPAHNQMSELGNATGITEHLTYEIEVSSSIILDLSGLNEATLKKLESADTIYTGGFGRDNCYGQFDPKKRTVEFSPETLKELDGKAKFTGFAKGMHSLAIGKRTNGGKMKMFFVALVKAK